MFDPVLYVVRKKKFIGIDKLPSISLVLNCTPTKNYENSDKLFNSKRESFNTSLLFSLIDVSVFLDIEAKIRL